MILISRGDSYSGCLRNITATTGLLTALGFKINHEKSVLTPTQTIKFLGFLLDSVQMVISLTAERKVCILAVCKSLLGNNLLKIRDVASGIGSLVAALPGVSHGALLFTRPQLLLDSFRMTALNGGEEQMG